MAVSHATCEAAADARQPVRVDDGGGTDRHGEPEQVSELQEAADGSGPWEQRGHTEHHQPHDPDDPGDRLGTLLRADLRPAAWHRTRRLRGVRSG